MYTYRQIKSALETAPGLELPQFFGQSLTPDALAQLSAAPHLQSFLAEMKAKAKQALETPLNTLPFSRFRTSTLAPATAAVDGSVTVPVRVPRSLWANVAPMKMSTRLLLARKPLTQIPPYRAEMLSNTPGVVTYRTEG